MDIIQLQLMYVTTHVIKWCLWYVHYGVRLLFTCSCDCLRLCCDTLDVAPAGPYHSVATIPYNMECTSYFSHS
jgi:hypothetical protein